MVAALSDRLESSDTACVPGHGGKSLALQNRHRRTWAPREWNKTIELVELVDWPWLSYEWWMVVIFHGKLLVCRMVFTSTFWGMCQLTHCNGSCVCRKGPAHCTLQEHIIFFWGGWRHVRKNNLFLWYIDTWPFFECLAHAFHFFAI